MVIDLKALEAAAFSENGDVAVVERRWLMDVFHALQGAAFRAENVELRRDAAKPAAFNPLSPRA